MTKTIAVSDDVHSRIRAKGYLGETMSQVLERILADCRLPDVKKDAEV